MNVSAGNNTDKLLLTRGLRNVLKPRTEKHHSKSSLL